MCPDRFFLDWRAARDINDEMRDESAQIKPAI